MGYPGVLHLNGCLGAKTWKSPGESSRTENFGLITKQQERGSGGNNSWNFQGGIKKTPLFTSARPSLYSSSLE